MSATAADIPPQEFVGPALTAHDRCDTCGAEAKCRVRRANYKAADAREWDELLFCGHHQRKNFDALVDAGWVFAA